MKELEILKQNTEMLINMYKLNIPMSEKIGILEQLNKNLRYLKENLASEEYSERFAKIEQNVQKIIGDLTDPDFIQELVTKVQAIMGIKF